MSQTDAGFKITVCHSPHGHRSGDNCACHFVLLYRGRARHREHTFVPEDASYRTVGSGHQLGCAGLIAKTQFLRRQVDDGAREVRTTA